MTFSHSSDATTNISTGLKTLSHKVVQKSPPSPNINVQLYNLIVNGSQLHGKNEKEYSWHVPAMKFIEMKQLV